MKAAVSSAGESAGELLLRAAALVPWTRYFLAYERQRTVVSLFDVTGLTETEYC